MLLSPASALAQSRADLAQMERTLKERHPKSVEVCFDISGSMENLNQFNPLREALIPLLRNGLGKGDRCVITSFDTEPRVLFDESLKDDADVESVIQALPSSTTPNKIGTDIRWPHHEGLKRAAERGLPASYIILVTDSYNDTPSLSDPVLPNYLKYYTLDDHRVAKLAVYPKSPENQDYERLLRERKRLNITTWGIGIGINPQSGRPIERIPRYQESGDVPPKAATTVPVAPAAKSRFPWLPFLIGALVGAAVVAWLSMNRPVRVSLSEVGKRHQNYSLRPKETIVLGGSAAKGDERGYPIPGPLQPSAYLQRGGRDFTLRPGEAASAGEAALFLNNEELKGPRRIDYSDDIKIRVTRPGQDLPPTEHRLQFGRAIDTDEV
jgi:hypothetical protein